MFKNNGKHKRILRDKKALFKKKLSGIKCSEKLSLLSHTKQTSAGLHLGGESQGMIWHNTKQQKILIQQTNMSRDTHTHTHLNTMTCSGPSRLGPVW